MPLEIPLLLTSKAYASTPSTHYSFRGLVKTSSGSGPGLQGRSQALSLSFFSALTLSTHDLHVQVGQPTGSRQGQLNHSLDRHRVSVKVIEQGAVLMIVRDKPQLCPGAIICREPEMFTIGMTRTASLGRHNTSPTGSPNMCNFPSHYKAPRVVSPCCLLIEQTPTAVPADRRTVNFCSDSDCSARDYFLW